MRSRRSGFSLLEMILCVTILSGLVLSIFWAFEYGAKAFTLSQTRQGVQGELLRISSAMMDTLRHSHIRTVSCLVRELNFDGEVHRRDGLCLAGVKDWRSLESFDQVNGLPKWDRYVLFYGTFDGKLVRCHLDPPNPDYSPVPFPDLVAEDYLNDEPSSNRSPQFGFSVLSVQIKDFVVEKRVAENSVLVRLKLQEARARSPETAEFELRISPQNSWPKPGGSS